MKNVFINSLFQILFTFSLLLSQSSVVTITYSEKISLREISERYFENPDDWELILKFNGINSIADLSSGTKLKIPIQLYKSIVSKLEETEKFIQQANKEGAGLLAKEKINSALNEKEKAVSLKGNGDLVLSNSAAQSALFFAKEALQDARSKRVKSITAILSEKKGLIETKKSNQVVWNSAKLKQELFEKERLRTFSNSNGQILFIDGSRLQIGENALAVIEAMKQDLISNTNTTDVVVLQGDISTYLSTLSQKNQMNVSAPGVETKIRSRKFWTGRDENQVVRVANYNGEIDLAAAGKKVTIGQDEGSKIEPGKVPTDPKKLLSPPQILSPTSNQSFSSSSINFKWERVQGASTYLIEIASNKNFGEILVQESLSKTSFTWKLPKNGIFFLHVNSVDSDKLPGPFSDAVEFSYFLDKTPPFLVVENPKDEEIFFSEELTISGKTESSVQVLVNDELANVGIDGSFIKNISLNSGKNKIVVQAIDKAKNKSEVVRNVICNLQEEILVLESPSKIFTNSHFFVVKGKAKQNAKIKIGDEIFVVKNTDFEHTISLINGSQFVTIEVELKGKLQTETLNFVVDSEPPKFYLSNFSKITSEKDITLTGSISEIGEVFFESEKLKLKSNNSFEKKIKLRNGKNFLKFEARDQAGNSVKKKYEITLDNKPPEIISSKVSKQSVKGDENLEVSVLAKDGESGLARTGNFSIKIGTKELSGVLKLSSNTYTGSVFVPFGVSGSVKLSSIKIKDYVGNETIQ